MHRPIPSIPRCSAEFIGTFWLLFGGVVSVVTEAAFPGAGLGLPGGLLVLALAVLTVAYATERLSGSHLNPLLPLGLAACKRLPVLELPAYLVG